MHPEGAVSFGLHELVRPYTNGIPQEVDIRADCSSAREVCKKCQETFSFTCFVRYLSMSVFIEWIVLKLRILTLEMPEKKVTYRYSSCKSKQKREKNVHTNTLVDQHFSRLNHYSIFYYLHHEVIVFFTSNAFIGINSKN